MLPDPEASERLARIDIEKYGIGKIRSAGTREKPFYSTANKLFATNGKILPESKFGPKMHALQSVNLSVIELEETEQKADELLAITKQIFDNHNMEFLTYNRKATYCENCKKSWLGLLPKCPSCSSIGTLTFFDRYKST
jgi:anaerobic ribonucleoside-triphosphate reductase